MIHTDTRGSLDERNVVFLRYSTTECFSVFYNSVLVFWGILQTTVLWCFSVWYGRHGGRSSEFSTLLDNSLLLCSPWWTPDKCVNASNFVNINFWAIFQYFDCGFISHPITIAKERKKEKVNISRLLMSKFNLEHLKHGIQCLSRRIKMYNHLKFKYIVFLLKFPMGTSM